jgi:hypothetical protein
VYELQVRLAARVPGWSQRHSLSSKQQARQVQHLLKSAVNGAIHDRACKVSLRALISARVCAALLPGGKESSHSTSLRARIAQARASDAKSRDRAHKHAAILQKSSLVVRCCKCIAHCTMALAEGTVLVRLTRV